MIHYERKTIKHFYESTCPYCGAVMMYNSLREIAHFTNKNGELFCEACYKLYKDKEIKDVEPPKTEYVVYVKES